MKPLADISGNDATHSLGPSGTRASIIQVIVSGAGTCRLGQGATASLGLPIAAGDAQMLPFRGQLNWYDLGAEKIYVPTGATVSVAYVP